MSRSGFRDFIRENYGDLPQPTGLAPKGPAPLPPLPTAGPMLPPLPTAPTTDTLPAFLRASHIVPASIVLPELLIDSLLHRGCKMVLTGGSKSFKSWVLMHLAMCICNAEKWWGLQTKKGTTIYLNFELIGGFFEERIVSMARAMGCALPENFIYWNLRGYCYDLALLAKVLLARLSEIGPVALIVVDPVYKALGDLDENSAGDMTKLMNLIEAMATQVGAAVAFGHHHPKGNAATKSVKDRSSGSGVFSRDPDVILDMTRHQAEDAYIIESELRYLPRLSPFVVKWRFPIMAPDESLDPRQFWEPGVHEEKGGSVAGGPNTQSEDAILNCLPDGGAQDNLWRKMVALRYGKAGTEFYTHKMTLLNKKLVVKMGQKYYKAHLVMKTS